MDKSPVFAEPANAASAAPQFDTSPKGTRQFRAHKALPRPTIDTQRALASATSNSARRPSEDRSASLDNTPLASPSWTNGQEPTLPPTPPGNSTELTRDSNTTSSTLSDSVFGSKTPSLSTPINQRSPPTPDPSPPRTTETLMHETRPSLLQLSSRAESFRTAREEQWSSEDDADRRSHFSSSGGATVKNTDPIKKSDRRNSLGLAFEREGSATPTGPSPLRYEARLEQNQDGPSADRDATPRTRKAGDIPKREWDTNLMRNVSVRRKRRSITPTENSNSNEDSAQHTPSSHRNFSAPQRLERPVESPSTPTLEHFARTIEWPEEVNSALNAHIRDSGKRMSGESTASTVVEAIVISTPPQRRRTLRHTSKNFDLRQTTDSPSESSPRVDSNRNSLVSEETPRRGLVHRNSRIPDRRNRDSAESNFSVGNVSPSPSAPIARTPDGLPALAVRKRRDHLKPLAVDASNRRSVSQPTPTVSSAQALVGADSIVGLFDTRFSEATSNRGSIAASDCRRQSAQSLASSRVVGTPGHRNFSAPLTAPAGWPSIGPNSRPESLRADKSPTLGRRFASEPRADLATDATPKTPKSAKPAMQIPDIAVDTSHVPLAENSFILSPQSEDRVQLSPMRARRPSNDGTVTEEIPRPSFDMDAPLFDPKRSSSERGTSRMDEHAMARITYSQSTPFSQTSGLSDALEVSEATAVSIFPHNNHSLLVVQQAARPSTSTTTTSNNFTAPDALAPPQPSLTIEPATPPNHSTTFDDVVDSPLRNPRKPPEPPALKIIPPTPSQELEKELAGPPADNQLPQRRPSLLQRARRYSDTYIAPILSRGPSLRRRAGHPPRGRVPGVSDQDTNLHPFWRPRGFWDDFSSDSDSDSEFGFDPARDRLPRGGDTSSPPPPPPRTAAAQLTRRLTSSFRGTGGFLIGNSLGVERAGTNVRRHHVALPARLASLRRRRQLAAERDAAATRERERNADAVFRAEMPSPLPPDAARSLHSGTYLDLSGSSSSLAQRQERPAAPTPGAGAAGRKPGLGGGAGGVRRLRRVAAFGRGGIPLPGTRRRLQLQYVGLSGVRERIREMRAEKRRERLRGRIGGRVLVVDGVVR